MSKYDEVQHFQILDTLDMMHLESLMDYDDVTDVLNKYSEARYWDEMVGQLKKKTAGVLKRYKEVTVPETFTEKGVSTVSMEGFRYTVGGSSRTSIPAPTKLVAYDWLRENGLGDLITETVNSQTLSATAKSLLEDGIELPDELFKTFLYKTTSMTKLK